MHALFDYKTYFKTLRFNCTSLQLLLEENTVAIVRGKKKKYVTLLPIQFSC